MKEWYYKKLLNKLANIYKLVFSFPLKEKITLRIGNKTINDFNKFELEDLYYLWKDEAKKKWKIN